MVALCGSSAFSPAASPTAHRCITEQLNYLVNPRKAHGPTVDSVSTITSFKMSGGQPCRASRPTPPLAKIPTDNIAGICCNGRRQPSLSVVSRTLCADDGSGLVVESLNSLPKRVQPQCDKEYCYVATTTRTIVIGASRDSFSTATAYSDMLEHSRASPFGSA
jgi:hypothetical protein